MEKVDNMEGYRIVHITPDVSEEEKEEIKQTIVKNIYKLFSNDKCGIDTKVK